MFRIKTLRGKILVTFLGTLLIGMIISIVLSTVSVVSFSQDAADNSADTIKDEELLSLDRLAGDKSLLIEEFFNQIVSEMALLENMATDLFNGRLGVTQLSSYNNIATIDPSEPPNIQYDEINDRTVSFEASGWYLPGISSLDEVDHDIWSLVNISSNLDMGFRALYEANDNYANLYFGFENDGLVHFQHLQLVFPNLIKMRVDLVY
jgi:hypothetical protein